MAIKVQITRNFKPGTLEQASRILIRARYQAMGMPGYIASETWSDLNDPHKVVVVSMWQSIDNWNQWQDSPQRGEFVTELGKIMLGGEHLAFYALGINQTTS
ncbi:MAG: antibiotic biosynthesis monooxygenase family protein [Desulfobacterales bacterium]|nr:antibiotic biosynthesis monooxygenase family protein [Desulfobacterales bacterium]